MIQVINSDGNPLGLYKYPSVMSPSRAIELIDEAFQLARTSEDPMEKAEEILKEFGILRVFIDGETLVNYL